MVEVTNAAMVAWALMHKCSYGLQTNDELDACELQAFARHRIAAEKAGYERGLRGAADDAKIGWLTVNGDIVGITDADMAMRLCKHVVAVILSRLENK